MAARERITQGDGVTDDRTIYLRDSLDVRESSEIYDGHGTIYETPAETSGTYYGNPVGLIIPLQVASAVTVQDVLYPLNPLRFGIQVYLDDVDRRKVLRIRDRDGKPLFKVVFRSIEGQEGRYPILLDEEAIQEQTAMPSCVWHNNVGIKIYLYPEP